MHQMHRPPELKMKKRGTALDEFALFCAMIAHNVFLTFFMIFPNISLDFLLCESIKKSLAEQKKI